MRVGSAAVIPAMTTTLLTLQTSTMNQLLHRADWFAGALSVHRLLCYYFALPRRDDAEYCDEYVCLSVCLTVCLSARVTRKLHG